MLKKVINKPIQYLQYISKNHKVIHQNFEKNELIPNLLKKSKIQTFFQPILDIKTGGNIGFEVLNRPEASGIFPTTDLFYDFVGESNHVFTVERFMRNLSLERYDEQIKETNDYSKQDVFLNIHPKVLADPNYQTGTTRKLIEEYDIPPENIILEITEKQANIDYDDEFAKVVENYREQGFRIAVDDAGTGYNGLQTLLFLNPEIIKIDKSLIRDIDRSPEKQHLVEIMLNFAEKSKTKVLAEGIETEEEYNFLKKMGIHLGQGYAIGKPKKTLINGSAPRNVAEIK